MSRVTKETNREVVIHSSSNSNITKNKIVEILEIIGIIGLAILVSPFLFILLSIIGVLITPIVVIGIFILPLCLGYFNYLHPTVKTIKRVRVINFKVYIIEK